MKYLTQKDESIKSTRQLMANTWTDFYWYNKNFVDKAAGKRRLLFYSSSIIQNNMNLQN